MKASRSNWVAAAVMVLMLVARTHGATWYVAPPPAGSDTNEGAESTPFATITNAVAQSADNDTIYLFAGTHVVSNEVLVAKGITIEGIDGATNTIVSRAGSDLFRVFQVTHTDAVLRGITVSNGSVTNGNGGAVHMTAGLLADCVIENSRVELLTDGGGGGVFMSGGTVTNCVVDNNRVANTGGIAYGGGIYMTGGEVLDSILKRNETTSDVSSRGGGLAALGDALVRGGQISANFVRTTVWAATAMGAGVYMTDGRLEGVRVASNEARPSSTSHGGGVYMTGGLVTDSTVAHNLCQSHYTRGGGIYMTGGTVFGTFIATNSVMGGDSTESGGLYISGANSLVDRCRVIGNIAAGSGSQRRGGGGLSLRDGTVRNTLVYGNEARSDHQGGGAYVHSGLMEHVTLAANDSVSAAGGGLRQIGGTVRNTIVYFNTGDPANVHKTGGVFTYSCSTPLVSGGSDVENIEDDPDFVNLASRDFRLLPGSPCIDTGTVGSPYDLDGTSRPLDGTGDGTPGYDRGCYEFDPAGGPLLCSIAGTQTRGLDSLTTTLSATLSGDTTGLYCWWDFGNGTLEGPDIREVVRAYTEPGRYTVSLVVSNALGETFSSVRTDWIWVVPDSDVYVATDGSGEFPYASRETATTNLLDAVETMHVIRELAAEHRTVWIDGGPHLLNGSVYLTRGMTIAGVTGAATDIVDGRNLWRCFNVTASASNTVLRNLTIRNGRATGDTGGGIRLAGPDSLIEYCIIRSNLSGGGGGGIHLLGAGSIVRDTDIRNNQSGDAGGGIHMTTGTVINCDIRENHANYHQARAGGVSISGGLLSHSTVVSNRISAGHTVGAAGILQSGGTVRNCLIQGNYESGGYDFRGGGGLWLSGGTVESCTIVDNYTRGNGLGLRQDAGTVINSIIYANRGLDPEHKDTARIGGTFSYSCTTPLISGGANIENIEDNPLFRNPGSGDYRLVQGSPASRRGLVQTWMQAEDAVDLAGNPRFGGGTVDMGCYQLPPTGSVIIIR